MTVRHQRHHVLGLLAVVLVAIVCLALVAEGIVRARSYLRHGYSSPRIESIYRVDPSTELRVPVPGARMGGIEINASGFRGEELEEPKPPGRLRLAFLGGSTTFCAEVSNNRVAWPHLVVQLLNDTFGDKRFDYINAAVPGYTVDASRRRLGADVADLDPDVVIIYHASNDLAKNSSREAKKHGLPMDRGDAGLSFPAKFSMLWYLVEKNLQVWQRQRDAFSSDTKLNVSLDALVKPFANDLIALATEAAAISDTVILVTFTTRMRRGQSVEELRKAAITSLYYMPYMTPDQLLSAFEAYNSAIREVAMISGAFLVDEPESLPANEANFVDSIHFTDQGSRKMAERVYRGLLKSGALDRHVQGSRLKTDRG